MRRWVVVLIAACGSEHGWPPVARITAAPRAVPEHNGFTTDVQLDGTASADPIDDPGGLLPLAFHWEILGDEARYQQGDRSSVAPVIRLAGERPATVRLTVTDSDGATASATFGLQLTITPVEPRLASPFLGSPL